MTGNVLESNGGKLERTATGCFLTGVKQEKVYILIFIKVLTYREFTDSVVFTKL